MYYQHYCLIQSRALYKLLVEKIHYSPAKTRMESLWLFCLCLNGCFFSSISSISLLARLSPVSSFFCLFCFAFGFSPSSCPLGEQFVLCSCYEKLFRAQENRLWETRVAYEFWTKQLVSVPKLDRSVWIPWTVASVISYCLPALSGQNNLLKESVYTSSILTT